MHLSFVPPGGGGSPNRRESPSRCSTAAGTRAPPPSRESSVRSSLAATTSIDNELYLQPQITIDDKDRKAFEVRCSPTTITGTVGSSSFLKENNQERHAARSNIAPRVLALAHDNTIVPNEANNNRSALLATAKVQSSRNVTADLQWTPTTASNNNRRPGSPNTLSRSMTCIVEVAVESIAHEQQGESQLAKLLLRAEEQATTGTGTVTVEDALAAAIQDMRTLVDTWACCLFVLSQNQFCSIASLVHTLFCSESSKGTLGHGATRQGAAAA